VLVYFGYFEGEDHYYANFSVSILGKKIHVHVYASAISLRGVLTWPGEGDIDHPIAFTRRKLSYSEKNYNTT
jgi:hypothetical protein